MKIEEKKKDKKGPPLWGYLDPTTGAVSALM